MNSRYPPASQEDGPGTGIKQFALGHKARKLPTWDLFHVNYQSGLHYGKVKTYFGGSSTLTSCCLRGSPTSPKAAIHIPCYKLDSVSQQGGCLSLRFHRL